MTAVLAYNFTIMSQYQRYDRNEYNAFCNNTKFDNVAPNQRPASTPLSPQERLEIDTASDRFMKNTSTITKSWKPTVVNAMTPLADTFVPGDFDVICSRGKKAKNHPGNVFFQSIIEKSAKRYANAEGKLGKSLIVSEIIDTIRRKSPHGGFVKQQQSDSAAKKAGVIGRWYEVGDVMAREKTGQSLRDLLAGQYRSSASSKKRRREESNAKMIEDLEKMVESNTFVSSRMKKLANIIEQEGKKAPASNLIMMMTQTNTEILRQLKADNAIQQHMKMAANAASASQATPESIKQTQRLASTLPPLPQVSSTVPTQNNFGGINTQEAYQRQNIKRQRTDSYGPWFTSPFGGL